MRQQKNGNANQFIAVTPRRINQSCRLHRRCVGRAKSVEGLETHISLQVMTGRFNYWQERMREPSLTALLVIALLLIFVVIPLDARHLVPTAILTLMVALFLIASFLVALQSRVAMFVFVVSAIVTQIAAIIHGKQSSPLTAWLNAGAQHTAICAVSWIIMKDVFGPGRLTVFRMEAAIVLYLNIALFFFTAYRLVVRLVPEAFSGLTSGAEYSRSAADLLYFSFAALISAAYDAITPATPLAHGLVKIESLVGLLYPAALLAWFITLQLKQRRAHG
jgi:hypothetical protein